MTVSIRHCDHCGNCALPQADLKQMQDRLARPQRPYPQCYNSPLFQALSGVFSVFIPSAFAQAPAAAAGGDAGLMSFLPIILMFVLLYFLMIRPQMKRAKEQKTMIDALQKGDEVVAVGGLIGKIVELSDQYATLEIASETKIMVQRPAIQTLLPKGTIKSIK
jgi:preprotein translocase subunit YajC